MLIPEGYSGPEGLGLRTADLRCSENPLLCKHTYDIIHVLRAQREHKPGTLISCSRRANYFSKL